MSRTSVFEYGQWALPLDKEDRRLFSCSIYFLLRLILNQLASFEDGIQVGKLSCLPSISGYYLYQGSSFFQTRLLFRPTVLLLY